MSVHLLPPQHLQRAEGGVHGESGGSSLSGELVVYISATEREREMSLSALAWKARISPNSPFWTTGHPTESDLHLHGIPRWLAKTLKTTKDSPGWFSYMSSFQQRCSTPPSNPPSTRLGNGINFKRHGSQRNRFGRGAATRRSLTLASRTGTDDSVRGRSVLGEGNAASVPLRKHWQLTARFLDWMLELLILTDLNSTNRNVTVCPGRFNSWQSWGSGHSAKNGLLRSLCQQWFLGIYSFESCARHEKIL